MTTRPTLEDLLKKVNDEVLIDIEQELLSGIVPSDGYAHSFCRKVNKMIDRGELCISKQSYRKVYLPTLNKAVQREMSRRYLLALKYGSIEPDKDYEQLSLNLRCM